MNANYISKTNNGRQLVTVFKGKKQMAGVTGLEPEKKRLSMNQNDIL
ncbi:hypothetical protein OAP51_06125 [Alphaproteobacteria bacterium]|nr:hypothetical protein [Alphaproteobacteria bacterium]